MSIQLCTFCKDFYAKQTERISPSFISYWNQVFKCNENEKKIKMSIMLLIQLNQLIKFYNVSIFGADMINAAKNPITYFRKYNILQDHHYIC